MCSDDKQDLVELKEIDKELDKYRSHYKMYVRLSVVKMVKQGVSRGYAAERFNVHRKSAENWVKLYNEKGLGGLVPDYSNCGLNCRLSDEQLIELKIIVTDSKKEYDVKSVKKLIKDKYEVTYTYKQTWVILTQKFGLKCENGVIV